MIVLCIIYVFVMFVWINLLKNRLHESYEENKKANTIAAKIFVCIIGAVLDIVEFAIIIRFLYALRRIG